MKCPKNHSGKRSKQFGKGSRRSVRLIVSILLVLLLALSPLAAWPFSQNQSDAEKVKEQQELISQLNLAKDAAQSKLDSLQQWLSEYLESSQTSEADLTRLQDSLKSSTDLIETLKTQLTALQTRNEELESLQEMSSTAYSDLQKKLVQTSLNLDQKTVESEDYYRQLCDSQAALAAKKEDKVKTSIFGGLLGIGAVYDDGWGAELIGGMSIGHFGLYGTARHAITPGMGSWLSDWGFSAGAYIQF